jgi:hypothetical protein
VQVPDHEQVLFSTLIKDFGKNLMPNITKTGIKRVDEKYKPVDDK